MGVTSTQRNTRGEGIIISLAVKSGQEVQAAPANRQPLPGVMWQIHVRLRQHYALQTQTHTHTQPRASKLKDPHPFIGSREHEQCCAGSAGVPGSADARHQKNPPFAAVLWPVTSNQPHHPKSTIQIHLGRKICTPQPSTLPAELESLPGTGHCLRCTAFLSAGTPSRIDAAPPHTGRADGGGLVHLVFDPGPQRWTRSCC